MLANWLLTLFIVLLVLYIFWRQLPRCPKCHKIVLKEVERVKTDRGIKIIRLHCNEIFEEFLPWMDLH